MSQWIRKEPTKTSKVGYRTVISKSFVHPDGSDLTADTYDKEGAVCIATIALTADGKVVVAKQFRLGPERVMWELPGGGLEAGEDPEFAAKRELLEETGFQAGSMEHLGTVYKHAWMNTRWEYFLARDCTLHPEGQNLDPAESIDVEEISIEQLLLNGREGKMTDTEALFLAYDKLKELVNGTKES